LKVILILFHYTDCHFSAFLCHTDIFASLLPLIVFFAQFDDISPFQLYKVIADFTCQHAHRSEGRLSTIGSIAAESRYSFSVGCISLLFFFRCHIDSLSFSCAASHLLAEGFSLQEVFSSFSFSHTLLIAAS